MNLMAQVVQECNLLPVSIIYPKSKKIWEFKEEIIFETNEGFYVNKANGFDFFSFNGQDESIVSFNMKDGENYYIVTRSLRGYALYLFDFKNFNLETIYKKNLTFITRGQKYSSTLVDILFYKHQVYLVTNFDLLIFENMSLFREGMIFSRRGLVPYLWQGTDRIVDLRILDDYLQVLAFRDGSYKSPFIIYEDKLVPSSPGPRRNHLSDSYMKAINTHLDHPIFIYRDRDGSKMISSYENFNLTIDGFAISASFENIDIRNEYGLLQVKEKGMILLKNGQEKCIKKIHLSQVVLKEKHHTFIKALVRDRSENITEHIILLN